MTPSQPRFIALAYGLNPMIIHERMSTALPTSLVDILQRDNSFGKPLGHTLWLMVRAMVKTIPVNGRRFRRNPHLSLVFDFTLLVIIIRSYSYREPRRHSAFEVDLLIIPLVLSIQRYRKTRSLDIRYYFLPFSRPTRNGLNLFPVAIQHS